MISKNTWPVILSVLLWAAPAAAQQQKSILQLAEEHYSRYEYKSAARLFGELAEKKNASPDVLHKLADCYRKTNNYAAAAALYQKVLELPDADADNLLYYADALKSQGHYADAKTQYGLYAQKSGKDVSTRLAGCDSALVWMQHQSPLRIENLRDLNTASAEWGAVWDEQQKIVFTSDSLRATMLGPDGKSSEKKFLRTGHSYQKLYRADTVHKAPDAVLVRGLDAALNNHRFHVGPAVFSAGFDTAYITFTDPGKIPYKRQKPYELYGTRRLELYVAVKKNGAWQKPQPFQYNQPDAYSMGHAALSKDGQLLYFTSDMPGGQGKTDIWYCEKQTDGTWGAPVNCGAVINTPEEEEFPTVNGSNELYFSSKGHAGMGGFDIFAAQGRAAQWSTPANLQHPLNSAGDDFHFVQNTRGEGMFASNRQGGLGDDDIYGFFAAATTQTFTETVKAVKVLEARAFDQSTRQPLADAVVTVFNTKRNDAWTQSAGIRLTIEPGHEYRVSASAPGYATGAADAFVADDRPDTVKVQVFLSRAVPAVNDVMVLKNVYFDYRDYHIRVAEYPALDSLVALMKRYPSLRVELAAHTDSRATEAYNMELSNNRAIAVAEYLQRQGIAANRMVAKGYGESRLVNRCADGVECSEEEHQANRRTEVRILER